MTAFGARSAPHGDAHENGGRHGKYGYAVRKSRLLYFFISWEAIYASLFIGGNMSIYIDVADYDDDNYPYQAFVGGRGDGKTYSALRMGVEHWMDNQDKFVFMRRTDKELKRLMDSRIRGEAMNPFKSLNSDFNWSYGIVPYADNVGLISERESGENGKMVACGDDIGYAVSLSTVAGLRGIDLTDCSMMIYDEFIAERHVRKMAGEGEAILNAIETIGRNRELRGEKPLKCFFLANAFDIYNPFFVELGVVDKVEKMINRGQHDYYDRSRGLAIHLLENSAEFNEMKSQTAIMKLTKGSRYYDMALNNDFVYNDFSLIGWRNVKGHRPVIAIGDVYIWSKKGQSYYYATYTPGRCQTLNGDNLRDCKYFFVKYGNLLREAFIRGHLHFETYDIKQQMLDYLRIK